MAPDSSNAFATPGTATIGSISTPRLDRIIETWGNARMVPNAPFEAPISPPTLPSNGARSLSPLTLCDSQSMVFLSSGVIDVLYSGLAISRPFAAIISLRNSSIAVGTPCSSCQSAL